MKPTRRFPENTRVFATHGVPSRSRNRRLGASYEAAQKKRATAHSFGRPPDLEPWGRGTNRVIEMCRKAGIAPPLFEENGPFAVVTFRVRVGQTAQGTTQVGDQVGPKSGLSQDQVKILRLCRQERTLVELMNASGRRNRTKFRDSFIKPLLEEGFLVLTIPGKPRSRMQRYRTTAAGLAASKEPERES